MIETQSTRSASAGAMEKVCTSCLACKPLDEFYRQSKAVDGRQQQCKACTAAKQFAKRQANLLTQREREKQWHASSSSRSSNSAACRRWSRDNRPAVAAHKALAKAVSRGHVRRASRCQTKGCDCDARLEAHHWSYDANHQLDVIWLCRMHHRQLHSGRRLRLKPGIARYRAGIPEIVHASRRVPDVPATARPQAATQRNISQPRARAAIAA